MKSNTVTVGGLCLLAVFTAAAQPVPRVETYFGYSYVRFTSSGLIPAFNANGGAAQFVYNFNPWLGFVADFGGYHNSKIGGIHVDNTLASFQFGPRFSFRKKKRVNPYVQTLFGGVWQTADIDELVPEPLISSTRLSASDTAFAIMAGGGLDVKLGRHVSLRSFEVNYSLTRLQNPVLDTAHNQNNIRYSGDVSFLFGGEKPAPAPSQPQTKVCPDGSRVAASASCPQIPLGLHLTARNEVCQGEIVTLNSTLDGNRGGVTYEWSVNGQRVSQAQHFDLNTSNLQPGSYWVGLTVSGPGYKPASAFVTVTVLKYQPPVGTVEAIPSEIYAGYKATLRASFHWQFGGPIQAPVFSASEGAVRGDQFDSSTVQFDPSVHTEQRKAVNITARASDNRSTGTANTAITVIQKATAAAIRLPDVLLPQDSPRVNNCGKRVLLEQLRAYFERDPGGKVVLVGHVAPNEKTPDLAESRVRNAAALLTASTGVCLAMPRDRVLVSSPAATQNDADFQPNFYGPSTANGPIQERRGQAVSPTDSMAEYRRVVVWFVASGAAIPETVTGYRSSAVLTSGALSCPR